MSGSSESIFIAAAGKPYAVNDIVISPMTNSREGYRRYLIKEITKKLFSVPFGDG